MSGIRLGDFEPAPVIQAKKKYQNFTVREIGGPAEILVWREAQAKKEREALAMREMAREMAKVKAGEGLPDGDGVMTTVQGETSRNSWQERLAHGMEMRRAYGKAEIITDPVAWVPPPPPKLSILKRLFCFITSFWKNANF